jgi:hypothetical protein
MNIELDALIEALRDELQEYGEMLALLDQEQEWILSRAPADLLQCVGQIQEQTRIMQAARAQRENSHSALSEALHLDAQSSFEALIPALPEEFRPLVGALTQENNQLLLRIQRRSRQNHMLLAHSIESLGQLINTLIPARITQTYDQSGIRERGFSGTRLIYDAVG